MVVELYQQIIYFAILWYKNIINKVAFFLTLLSLNSINTLNKSIAAKVTNLFFKFYKQKFHLY